jgi:hypothetical protein
MTKRNRVVGVTAGLVVAIAAALGAFFFTSGPAPAKKASIDYLRASYSPLHFRPAAETARDEDCLACHKEILEDRVLDKTPSGRASETALADYQRLSTYAGEQETFHRRHLTMPLARKLMNLRCNTCHQGHDPRDEAQGSSASQPANDPGFTLRKQVNVETVCLKCHGQMNWRVMKLNAPWPKVREEKPNGCFDCHDKTRTVRHDVPYLDAAAIETAGRENSDVCHGCHGGRAWYPLTYPYTRHPWPGMPSRTPEWAKERPTQ